MDDDRQAFEDRRHESRRKAKKYQRIAAKTRDPLSWFEQLYVAADGDVARVPWADMEPHPVFAEWLEKEPHGEGRPAIDVGCGLGDNAEALAAAGWNVTAFDLSRTAIRWARKRYERSSVDYLDSDLFHLPPAWIGRFDLVQETYTLQALPVDMHADASRRLAGLIAPGGRLLVICRSRDEDEVPDGPPWPIAYSELAPILECGLEEISVERLDDGNGNCHLRLVYQKPC